LRFPGAGLFEIAERRAFDLSLDVAEVLEVRAVEGRLDGLAAVLRGFNAVFFPDASRDADFCAAFFAMIPPAPATRYHARRASRRALALRSSRQPAGE
jgi:hypothetical protein